MDPLHYARLSLTGWVFAAFFLLAAMDVGGRRWETLLEFISASQAPIVVAVFAAIVGFGGPPAFGFLVEKVVDVSLHAVRMKLRQSAAVRLFYSRFAKIDALPDRIPPEAAGSFHAFFYTFASDNLVNWARRRRGQMFACFSCALASSIAFVVAGVLFGGFPLATAALVAVFVAALLLAGYNEYVIQRDVVFSWAQDVEINDLRRKYCDGTASLPPVT